MIMESSDLTQEYKKWVPILRGTSIQDGNQMIQNIPNVLDYI